MISQELLSILCCPETRQGLRAAEPILLEQINAKIAAGVVNNRAGRPVREKLEGGLVRLDGRFIYPIRHDIPVMLAEEAIALPHPEGNRQRMPTSL